MFVTKKKFDELQAHLTALHLSNSELNLEVNQLSLDFMQLRTQFFGIINYNLELSDKVSQLNNRVSDMEVNLWKERNPQKLKVGGKVKYLGKAGVILEVKFFNILDSNELHTFTRTIYSWQYFVKTKDFNGWVFERDLV